MLLGLLVWLCESLIGIAFHLLDGFDVVPSDGARRVRRRAKKQNCKTAAGPEKK